MQDVAHACAMSEPTKNNPAKTVAIELKDRAVFCVASEHLVGVAHMLSNQINENGKQLADYYEIPELNHHLMEGLTYPKGLVRRFTVLMMDSELYHPHNQRRYELTAQVFEKQGAKVIEYQSGGGSRLEELGEVMQFGSFVSYYTSMLNRVNPKDIPFVDWFKAELKK